jgi:predicted RNase H-like HicB family nuclease
MKTFTFVVEHCPDTDVYVGYVPGFPGAHSQGATMDELRITMAEVIQMLLEDGDPSFESEFAGTQTIPIG